MTAGLHRSLRDDILALWTAAAIDPTVPVYWRTDDFEPLPDPSTVPHFFRNEVSFGREKVMAFGGGNGKNLKAQFGSVVMRLFTARALGSEDVALDLMSAGLAAFRSKRITADALGNDLSFVGDGSGFDQGQTEDGNWFMRGSLMVYEYRFLG